MWVFYGLMKVMDNYRMGCYICIYVCVFTYNRTDQSVYQKLCICVFV